MSMNHPVMVSRHHEDRTVNERIWRWFRQRRETLRDKKPGLYVTMAWLMHAAALLELLIVGIITGVVVGVLWVFALIFGKARAAWRYLISIIAV
ncbi:MAG TPA: hypothetical protein VN081_01495 [Dongiaceae bacterium]|nr:hypothetical protein [Dongiaceae bacterium]